MSNPCLIVDITEADQWPNIWCPDRSTLGTQPVRMPAKCQPTVLQPNEQTAIEEARRRANAHPGRRFAIFEAKLVGMTVEVPSHVTVGGEVFQRTKVARIVELGDGIPF